MKTVAVIIPSFNNPAYLVPCVQSILMNASSEDFLQIYLVNNGDRQTMEPFLNNPHITVLQQEKNLGWEGGLKAGVEASKEPYIVFMNDDTYVPYTERLWLNRMLGHFSYPDCGAVGPTSNCVMGNQNVFILSREPHIKTKFLIGFCLMIKREVLNDIGGVDDSLPGGDDLDLSIRLRAAGKHLICDRQVFIYHHGFKTGERLHGSASVPGGWNSMEMTERTNFALINKHGLRAFLDLWSPMTNQPHGMIPHNWGNSENEIVKSFTLGEKVAELGCGDKKLFDSSVGIDIVPRGQFIHGLSVGRKSLADVTANVEESLPISGFDTIIAQHILEHCVDAIGAVQAWKKALKHGGRLIVAVPNQSIRSTIPMNIEHVHAWTPASMKRFMELNGFQVVDLLDAKNNVSFVGIFQNRNGS